MAGFGFRLTDTAFVSFFAPGFEEGFEFPWSGTVENATYFLDFTFDPEWVEDFETGW